MGVFREPADGKMIKVVRDCTDRHRFVSNVRKSTEHLEGGKHTFEYRDVITLTLG